MRVISGKFKGKPLASPVSDNIRPTGDKVKQALFTKLHFFVVDSVVLDLFSGSGALGIEALSCGAKEVVFADKDRRSIALTKKNLQSVGENSKVVCADYKTVLSVLQQKFNLILVDPPYASGVYDDVMQKIAENKLLAEDGYVVCEHPNELKISAPSFDLVDNKRYGTVTLSYFKQKPNNVVVHSLSLRQEYFNLVKNNAKTLEGRLNDPKRQNMHIGDYVNFCLNTNNRECFMAKIVNRYEYKTFDEMIEFTNKKQLGFAGCTNEQVVNTYRQIYSAENEQKFGVVILEIQKI